MMLREWKSGHTKSTLSKIPVAVHMAFPQVNVQNKTQRCTKLLQKTKHTP